MHLASGEDGGNTRLSTQSVGCGCNTPSWARLKAYSQMEDEPAGDASLACWESEDWEALSPPLAFFLSLLALNSRTKNITAVMGRVTRPKRRRDGKHHRKVTIGPSREPTTTHCWYSVKSVGGLQSVQDLFETREQTIMRRAVVDLYVLVWVNSAIVIIQDSQP